MWIKKPSGNPSPRLVLQKTLTPSRWSFSATVIGCEGASLACVTSARRWRQMKLPVSVQISIAATPGRKWSGALLADDQFAGVFGLALIFLQHCSERYAA